MILPAIQLGFKDSQANQSEVFWVIDLESAEFITIFTFAFLQN